MSSIAETYERIAKNTLTKEFYLKKTRLKQSIDDIDVDSALHAERSKLQRSKVRFKLQKR